MSGSVIVAGARTPMGRLLGGAQGLLRPPTSAASPSRRALEKAGVAGDQVDYVIMGQVLQAGAGQIPARQAAVKARHPDDRPALTINKVCLSGLDAIALADQLIRAGEFDDRRRRRHGVDDQRAAPAAEVARGLQVRRRRRSSTRWPTTGSATAHRRRPMGVLTEQCNAAGASLTREEQDEFAARSPPAGRRGVEERRLRRRDRPGRDPAAQGRPDRVHARTRASAPTPPPSRSASCARRSPRTARSPPAPPRRSPTAPPRSS